MQPWGPLDEWDRATVAVDAVVLTVEGQQLQVLVHRRQEAPQAGKWALPGVFVNYPERDADAVQRALKLKTQVAVDVHLEQLNWSNEPDRDPRGWIVTHAYLGLAPSAELRRALEETDAKHVALAPVLVPWTGETGGFVYVHPHEGSDALAFDHNQLVGLAVGRLRGKLRYTALGLELMPDEFTLREFQDVFEAILDQRLNRATFQKLVLDDLQLLEATGEREPLGVGRRRAQLYRRHT
jgi:8-oxo-dGTP diphosphatase